MGGGTTGMEQLKMSSCNVAKAEGVSRDSMSLERAVVEHRAVVMCERHVCRNQQGE